MPNFIEMPLNVHSNSDIESDDDIHRTTLQAAVAAQSVVADIGKASTVSPAWEDLSPPGEDHFVFSCLGDGCLMLGRYPNLL